MPSSRFALVTQVQAEACRAHLYTAIRTSEKGCAISPATTSDGRLAPHALNTPRRSVSSACEQCLQTRAVSAMTPCCMCGLAFGSTHPKHAATERLLRLHVAARVTRLTVSAYDKKRVFASTHTGEHAAPQSLLRLGRAKACEGVVGLRVGLRRWGPAWCCTAQSYVVLLASSTRRHVRHNISAVNAAFGLARVTVYLLLDVEAGAGARPWPGTRVRRSATNGALGSGLCSRGG